MLLIFWSGTYFETNWMTIYLIKYEKSTKCLIMTDIPQADEEGDHSCLIMTFALIKGPII